MKKHRIGQCSHDALTRDFYLQVQNINKASLLVLITIIVPGYEAFSYLCRASCLHGFSVTHHHHAGCCAHASRGNKKLFCSARDKYHRITRAKSPVRLKCLLSFLRLMPHSFRRRCRARGDILSFGPMCDKETSSEKNLFEVDALSHQSLLNANE